MSPVPPTQRRFSSSQLAGHALVVDDVEEVRELFAHFLGRSGMRVTQADGGRAALAAARVVTPDVVVTDISMPDMDGLELCRQLRAEPVLQHLLILVVSGNGPATDPAVWAAGCDEVLEKPCSRVALVTTVQRLLDTGRRRRQSRPSSLPRQPRRLHPQ